MPHLGKPYPFPIHRDVSLWRNTPTHRMAKSYTLTYRVSPSPGGSCEFIARSQASDPVEYLYDDVTCRWQWNQPCPSGYYFFLEWMYRQRLEDFHWRWSLWQGATLINRTVELTNPGLESSPTIPLTGQWGAAGTGTHIPVILANPFPTPW